MKPQDKIRIIWQEIKALKRMREDGVDVYDNPLYETLEKKYEEIDTLFGHESTLSKAIIFYLNSL